MLNAFLYIYFQNGSSDSKGSITNASSESPISPLNATTASAGVSSSHPNATHQSSVASTRTNQSAGCTTDDEMDIEMPPPMGQILTTHPIPGGGGEHEELHEKLVRFLDTLILLSLILLSLILLTLILLTLILVVTCLETYTYILKFVYLKLFSVFVDNSAFSLSLRM